MLFLIRTDVALPADMDPEIRADFLQRERDYVTNLQHTGVIKALWQVVGERSQYSIYDTDDLDRLHSILEGSPMFAFLAHTLTPLAQHPDALAYYLNE
ncbi:muconolactone Delta-isomerase [Corynebacterium uterequi]|uniref:Muconolactone Delta-isomerase n=1 Tax=Corynebacterium uterequi TaxID=1072256 RepID=A0A0G3HIE3_9CORY|nr:muconolactone Delta-isomerase family protein [Corynebacterium uterequi]AKK11663.1 muconolactone delta-isomerase [Corynebacterium uterequi]